MSLIALEVTVHHQLEKHVKLCVLPAVHLPAPFSAMLVLSSQFCCQTVVLRDAISRGFEASTMQTYVCFTAWSVCRVQ